MPLMGIWLHLGLHEADHLASHCLQRVVESTVAEMAGADHMLNQLDETLAGLRVVRLDERDNRVAREHLPIVRLETEVVGAYDLGLAHGNAAEDLRRIFADADLRQKRFNLTKAMAFLKTAGISRHLLDAFDIGREPRKAVASVLLALHQLTAERVARAHLGPNRNRGAPDKPLGVFRSLVAEAEQIGSQQRGGGVAHLGGRAHPGLLLSGGSSNSGAHLAPTGRRECPAAAAALTFFRAGSARLTAAARRTLFPSAEQHVEPQAEEGLLRVFLHHFWTSLDLFHGCHGRDLPHRRRSRGLWRGHRLRRRRSRFR